jgi:hypothetical protein
VNWTTDGNDSASSYNVYGTLLASGSTQPASDAAWTLLDNVTAVAGQSSYTDSISGLTPSTGGDSGTVYYAFQVTAVNDFGESAATSPTSAVASPVAPVAPMSLTATLAAGNVVLNWTTGDSSGDPLTTGYNVYESTDNGSTFNFFDSVAPATAGDAPPTTCTATGLTAGTTPQFYVTATNASGESSASNSAGVAAPAAPGGLAVALSGDDESATITWQQSPNAIGYYVTRLTDGSTAAPYTLPEVTPGTTTRVVDSGSDLAGGHLDPTVAYSWTVTAVYPTSLAIGYGSGSGSGDGGSGGGVSGGDSGGDTDGSNGSSSGTGTGSASDSTDDYTGNITGFTATVSGTTVNFTWGYQGSATFELEQEDTSDPGTNFAWVASPTGRTASISGLNPGDRYKFRLRADRSDGTVSDYVSASANIPVPDSDTLSVAPPTVTTSNEQTFSGGVWTGNLTFSPVGGLPSGDSLTDSLSRDDDPLDVDPVTFTQGFDQTLGLPDGVLMGTTGVTYSLTYSVVDASGNSSAPSSPVKIALAGITPPPISITAAGNGSNVVSVRRTPSSNRPAESSTCPHEHQRAPGELRAAT